MHCADGFEDLQNKTLSVRLEHVNIWNILDGSCQSATNQKIGVEWTEGEGCDSFLTSAQNLNPMRVSECDPMLTPKLCSAADSPLS